MALQREYYPSDTLKLINQSESLVVRNAVLGNATTMGVEDKYVAHTIGRHLVKGSPGALGLGVPLAEFRDRFLNAPDNVNSAWAGKGEMAIILCELLNDQAGQYALGLLDGGVGRVVVHYLNAGKLAALHKNAKFKESIVTVIPASTQLIDVAIMNPKTNQPVMVNGVPKTVQRSVTTPKQASASVKAADIASVNAVLDCYGQSSLHLQTFYPSSEMVTSYVEWNVGTLSKVATFDGGFVAVKTL